MGKGNLKKALEMKRNFDKIETHGNRIMDKVDDEMYLISKSEKNEEKKEQAQKNLAIFIIAELLDSFDKKDAVEIIEVFDKSFKE